ncbi:MAG: thioesterase [Gordonia sp.]|nr:thioesterase [Gordonia sp. (in: high G+C Gram-positive bacteria)]
MRMSQDSPLEKTAGSFATDTTQEAHHEGGFRPDFDIDLTRGGPRYGEFIEEVRTFMDRVKAALPSEELVAEVIDELKVLNKKLDEVAIDEWRAPSGGRIDLPARGNITLPPYEVDEAGEEGVRARLTFRRYHLGGNNAAHGGQVAVAFDDLMGMAGALGSKGITRTAYLTVNYRAITPLNTELKLRSWVDRMDGRKVFLRATLHNGDTLCAEADGLFIKLNPGQP